jgi:hypothetical protein
MSSELAAFISRLLNLYRYQGTLRPKNLLFLLPLWQFYHYEFSTFLSLSIDQLLTGFIVVFLSLFKSPKTGNTVAMAAAVAAATVVAKAAVAAAVVVAAAAAAAVVAKAAVGAAVAALVAVAAIVAGAAVVAAAAVVAVAAVVAGAAVGAAAAVVAVAVDQQDNGGLHPPIVMIFNSLSTQFSHSIAF